MAYRHRHSHLTHPNIQKPLTQNAHSTGVSEEDLAQASVLFDKFCAAQTCKSILGTFRLLCDVLKIQSTRFNQFYPELKSKLRSWRAQALWAKFDKRAAHRCYSRGKACPASRVLIIGGGPVGLRTAVEAQLLGAKVVVVEKRDRFSRNNVVHLWPFVIHDLKALGAKKFYGKFCAGAIDHISIRQFQCIMLKVALLLGVEVHESVAFEDLLEPPEDQENGAIGWRARFSPPDHPVSQYEFDILVGADGKRNTLKGFKRKEFRGRLAIAITANFINRHTEAEARVEEISGVAFIFNQKFFKELNEETGIDLENIVYYKDETHYFVMTAKKHSLLAKHVILKDYADTASLLSPGNVDREALYNYAREAADFSTQNQLPDIEFAVNHYGQPDVAMFDFTSMYAADNACRVIERKGYRLLMALVGDSLLEPFWPTGSGCARGFLSAFDAAWMMRSWALGKLNPLQVLAERESIYRLLAQTTPENLSKDFNSYTLEPHTRYPNLNLGTVQPFQVRTLVDAEHPEEIISVPPVPGSGNMEVPRKKRRRESVVRPETLLAWLSDQTKQYKGVDVRDLGASFSSGLALCAIIHRYRPDLLDFHDLRHDCPAENNQLAFDILQREYSIVPMMTGHELSSCPEPDPLAMVAYLSQVYEVFRREIPRTRTISAREMDLAMISEEMAQHARNNTFKPHAPFAAPSAGTHHSRPPSAGPGGTAGGGIGAKRARKKRMTEKERRAMDMEIRAALETVTPTKIGSQVHAQPKANSGVGKPRDLVRAIGRIEETDWNVKQIEAKLAEHKKPAPASGAEAVPKWNRDRFQDKVRALTGDAKEKEEQKFGGLDSSLKRLERKLREGSSLEAGERGANKVSKMANELKTKLEGKSAPVPPPPKPQSPNPLAAILPGVGSSDLCHFCKQRVYLMERQSAEGRFFHRGCFRCEYCNTALRIGTHCYERNERTGVGGRFLCSQHYHCGYALPERKRFSRKAEEIQAAILEERALMNTELENLRGGTTDKTDFPVPRDQVAITRSRSRVMTPERIEFENSIEVLSESDDQILSEIDEEVFTEKNFRAGITATESEMDEEGSSTSTEEPPSEDAMEELEGLMSEAGREETQRLLDSWERRHPERKRKSEDKEEEPANQKAKDVEATPTKANGSKGNVDEPESDTEEEGSASSETSSADESIEDSGDESDAEDSESSDSTSGSSSAETEDDSLSTDIETDSEFERNTDSIPQPHLPRRQVSEPAVRVRCQEQHSEEITKKGSSAARVAPPRRRPPRKTRQAPPSDSKAPPKGAPAPKSIGPFSGVRPSSVVGPGGRGGPSPLARSQTTSVVPSSPRVAPEIMSASRAMELKRSFLLGSASERDVPSALDESNKRYSAANYQGSLTRLGGKQRYKDFLDKISESQKLLNPAPAPSAPMKIFLERVGSNTTSVEGEVTTKPPFSPSPLMTSSAILTSLSPKPSPPAPLAVLGNFPLRKEQSESCLPSLRGKGGLPFIQPYPFARPRPPKPSGESPQPGAIPDVVPDGGRPKPELIAEATAREQRRAAEGTFFATQAMVVEQEEEEEEPPQRPPSPPQRPSSPPPPVKVPSTRLAQLEQRGRDMEQRRRGSQESIANRTEPKDSRRRLSVPTDLNSPPLPPRQPPPSPRRPPGDGSSTSSSAVSLSRSTSLRSDRKEAGRRSKSPYTVSSTSPSKRRGGAVPKATIDNFDDLLALDTTRDIEALSKDFTVLADPNATSTPMEEEDFLLDEAAWAQEERGSPLMAPQEEGGGVKPWQTDRVTHVQEKIGGAKRSQEEEGGAKHTQEERGGAKGEGVVSAIPVLVTPAALEESESIGYMDSVSDSQSPSPRLEQKQPMAEQEAESSEEEEPMEEKQEKEQPMAEEDAVTAEEKEAMEEKEEKQQPTEQEAESSEEEEMKMATAVPVSLTSSTEEESADERQRMTTPEVEVEVEGRSPSPSTTPEVPPLPQTEAPPPRPPSPCPSPTPPPSRSPEVQFRPGHTPPPSRRILFPPSPVDLNGPSPTNQSDRDSFMGLDSSLSPPTTGASSSEKPQHPRGDSFVHLDDSWSPTCPPVQSEPPPVPPPPEEPSGFSKQSPFGGIRDSISLRKGNIRKSSTPPPDSPPPVPPPPPESPRQPVLSTEVERERSRAINQSRERERDLVREMVLGKIKERQTSRRRASGGAPIERLPLSIATPPVDTNRAPRSPVSTSPTPRARSEPPPKSPTFTLPPEPSPAPEEQFFTPSTSLAPPPAQRQRPLSLADPQARHYTPPHTFGMQLGSPKRGRSRALFTTPPPPAPPATPADPTPPDATPVETAPVEPTPSDPKEWLEKQRQKKTSAPPAVSPATPSRRIQELRARLLASGSSTQFTSMSDNEDEAKVGERLSQLTGLPMLRGTWDSLGSRNISENQLGSLRELMEDPVKSASSRMEAINRLSVFSGRREPVPPAAPGPAVSHAPAGPDAAGRGARGAAERQPKKSKDKERRKSIIQMVQGLFHRSEKDKEKKEATSPLPPLTGGGAPKHQSPPPAKEAKIKSPKLKDRASPFRLKAKGKNKDRPSADQQPTPSPPGVPVETPPTPAADTISPHSEGSGGKDASVSSLRRSERALKRAARQAEQKRLRVAQEIQRQLEELEVKQKEVEARGVEVEKQLRGEGQGKAEELVLAKDDGELMQEWFALVHEKTQLVRYEQELLVRAKELELEDRHARLQQELRDRMATDDSFKDTRDIQEERDILNEILGIVEQRDALVAMMESDRLRQEKEDRDMEAAILAKGMKMAASCGNVARESVA